MLKHPNLSVIVHSKITRTLLEYTNNSPVSTLTHEIVLQELPPSSSKPIAL